MDESAHNRHDRVADACALRGYARSGSEGGSRTPPMIRAGVRLSAEAGTVKDAAGWREFWRERGMRELTALIAAQWPPLAEAPAGPREACAFRVASLLGSRAPRAALAEELGRIRRDELGLAP